MCEAIFLIRCEGKLHDLHVHEDYIDNKQKPINKLTGLFTYKPRHAYIVHCNICIEA